MIAFIIPVLLLPSVFCNAAGLRKRVSTVPLAHSPREVPLNPNAHHLAKAYARYGVPVSESLKRAAGEKGEVTSANKANDTYWVSPVSIDGQIVNLSKVTFQFYMAPHF